jgi:hypothetical protein
VWEPPRLAIINLQKKKKKKRHCKTFKPHLNHREMVREGSFRWDDFYIHQSGSIIIAKDRKPLSLAASRLHWVQMTSDKPILPVVTASVSTTTNATPVPSETQANTLPMGFESSDLLLTPPLFLLVYDG